MIVFENNEDDFFLLNGFLERQGFQVQRVKNYRDILTRALVLQPSLVFYSWSPEEQYGCQLLKSTPETRDIPLFLVVSREAQKMGQKDRLYADESISKPLNLTELEGRVYRLLASRNRTTPVASPPREAAPRAPAGMPRPIPIPPQAATAGEKRRGERSTQSPSPSQAAEVAVPPVESAVSTAAVAEPSREEAGATADTTPSLYDRSVDYVRESLCAAADGKSIDFDAGKEMAGAIHGSLLRDRSLLHRALDREQEYSLSRHSTNVCILACCVAMGLDQPLQNLELFSLAALFHDIGSVRLPPRLLFKAGRFSQREAEEIRRRPEHGRDIILRLEPGFKNMARIISQVCEREDGSGYPLGLRGTEILREAKIIGLADYYEAVTHPRPHRDAGSGLEALSRLTSADTLPFPQELVTTFIRTISLYSVKELVLLSSGDIAEVVELTDNPVRPTVEVILGAEGKRLPQPQRINLAEPGSPTISRSLSRADVMTRFAGDLGG